MDASKNNLRNNLVYEKSPEPFNPNEKSKIALLTTRSESVSYKGKIKEQVIFLRKDVDTKEFIKNQIDYKNDKDKTITFLKKELSKSNIKNRNLIEQFIKNIHSDIADMPEYSSQENEITKNAMDASNKFEDILDIIDECKKFNATYKKYLALPEGIRNENDSFTSTALYCTSDQRKILDDFNSAKLRYERFIKNFDHEFPKEIWKNIDLLESENPHRFNQLKIFEDASAQMKINKHKASIKIDYLKASLFEQNLDIFNIQNLTILEKNKGNIDSQKNSSFKNADNLKFQSSTWSKVPINQSQSTRNFLNSNQAKTLTISNSTKNNNVITNVYSTSTNSTKSILSNSGSSSEQESIKSSFNEKENTLLVNKLADSSNTLIETKAIASQEDQPLIQSHSARNMPRTPLRTPNIGSTNFPSAPTKPKN